MNAKELKKKSKFLSLILRHKPEEIGLVLDENGWADLEELISKSEFKGMQFTKAMIYQLVEENDKQRFKLSDDKMKIRANQGHSIKVKVDIPQAIPPEVLYHGTASKNIDSILENGINSGTRLHVHLSDEQETASKVGQRHGKPIILTIDAKKMSSDGIRFYLSENGVWLTHFVDKKYLTI